MGLRHLKSAPGKFLLSLTLLIGALALGGFFGPVLHVIFIGVATGASILTLTTAIAHSWQEVQALVAWPPASGRNDP